MRVQTAVMLVVALVACEKGPARDPSKSLSYTLAKENTSTAERTTLGEMRRAYDQNPGIFGDKYLKKSVEFDAKVKYILDASETGLSLTLEAPQTVNTLSIHDGAVKYADVRKGQKLTLRCVVFSADPLNMFLTDCVIVKPTSLLTSRA